VAVFVVGGTVEWDVPASILSQARRCAEDQHNLAQVDFPYHSGRSHDTAGVHLLIRGSCCVLYTNKGQESQPRDVSCGRPSPRRVSTISIHDDLSTLPCFC
jgi:hypothetical protein